MRLDAEEMPAPSGQLDVHAVDQIVSGALEPHLLRRVDEGPATTAKVGPWDAYQPGRHTVAQVDHDQPPHVALPAPRDQVVVSGVSGPTGKLTQLPLSPPQARLGQHGQERPVEPLDRRVRRFVRIPAEEHRKVNRPSFDLAVVDQPHPGLGESGDGGRLPARRAERLRGPRFVVVLDEPHQAALIAEVRLKVPSEPPRPLRAPAGRRDVCRSSSRSPAVAAPTPGPSRPRP